MSNDVTDQDRLAASLAGLLAAGFGNQPFEMARRLIEDGWSRGGTVTADVLLDDPPARERALLAALRSASRPLSVRGTVETVLGCHPGGRSWVLWRDSFRKLIDTERVVPGPPRGKRQRWVPAYRKGDVQ